jgi:Ricin-type beta-trefoil lectin domain
VSEQNPSERQRQERANLVNAFTRRMRQPSEQPRIAPRILAGGVALVLVAGAAFGVGAMSSYNHKKTAEERARDLALTRRENPPSSGAELSRTSVPTAPGSGAQPSSGAPQRSAPGHTLPQQAPQQRMPGAANTAPGTSVTPSVSPTEALLSDKEQRHLHALAAQQGGETAPHMPRVEQKTPTKATPSASAKAKTNKAAARTRSAAATGVRFSTRTNVLLHNVMTGLCADIPANDSGSLETPIQQYTCNGSTGDNQLWDLVVNGKGQGPDGADLFMIRNSKDNYCADLTGTGAVARAGHVTENLCYPGLGDNQVWYFQRRPGGYWIRNYVSNGFCLDVLGVNGAGGKDAPLTVVPCDPSDDHVWSLS